MLNTATRINESAASPPETAGQVTLRAPERKWGPALASGFQILPDTIIRHYARERLTEVDLVVLLNLLMVWWTAEQMPFPRVATIANRMQMSPRTVQRSLTHMRSRGLLSWEIIAVRGRKRRRYNLAPLVERAKEWAAEDLALQSQRPQRAPMSGRAGVQTQISPA